MSRYAWPASPREEERDDPAARARFVRRARREFDPDGAREAGRKALQSHAPAARGGRTVMKAPVVGAEFVWQPLGPVAVTGGQAVGATRVAGRVNMVAVHKDGERLYAASGNGGVWYSGNGGKLWQSLGGFATTPTGGIKRPAQRNACGAIEVAFGGAEGADTVYLGTGETTHPFQGDPGSSEGGIGVLVAQSQPTPATDDPWVREAINLVNEGVCRIALQPSGSGVVAATTAGLFERPAGGGKDCVWQKVQQAPFNTLTDKCADVLWTKGDGSRPERLWVWVQGGASAGLWVRDGATAPFPAFQQILAAPAIGPFRAVLSRCNPTTAPNQFYLLHDTGGAAPPALFRISCATNAKPTATAVTAGVPAIMGAGFGFYCIAIATHPTLPDRVVLGGSTFAAVSPDGVPLKDTAGTDDGAVIVGDVAQNGPTWTFGFPAASTMIGAGVHADLHDIVFSNNGNRLWAASDGGVYRSDQPTQQVGFYAANNGLAVIESNYIACHPTCEGFVVTGLQDNGVIARHSGHLWKHEGDGDGGGVMLDPTLMRRYIRQFFNGNWSSSDSLFGLPLIAAERNGAAFYSEGAAIAKQRGVPPNAPPNVRQVIIGTHRLWYNEDFGTTWYTLPSGTLAPHGNQGLDDFGMPITVCRWQSPDVAWVLGASKLMRYARIANSDAGGPPGTWGWQEVRPTDVVPTGKEKKRPPVPPSMNDAPFWTDVAVNLETGNPPVQRGTLGAVYLGTVGKFDSADVDTLYWFDGTDKWHATKLRTDPKGVPAPVTAIVCHPDFPLEVWVGTTVGVWHGVRTDHGANPPTWDWNGRVNGLPEAAVEDLEIFKDGTLVLLRAGIASRGVWELRLDVTTLQPLTYLRAHDDDLRYRDRAVEKQRDLLADRSWHGSPDVRPRRPAVLRNAPATLPWSRTTPNIDPELLRRFQSALRARTNDPRVLPTGKWDGYFNEALRNLGAPLLPAPAPANTVSINKAFWNLSMVAPHATAEPWGAGVPTEADLIDYALPLAEGSASQASCTLTRVAHKVDVVVHHRGASTQDGANVRVTLLKWVDPKNKNAAKWNDTTTWFNDPVPWTAAVNEVLNSADGKTSQAMTAGWSFVLGSGNVNHRLTLTGQTLDAMHPGIASFDLDLSTARNDSLILLVAVIRVGSDITLSATKLKDLALTKPSVAVRSVHVLG